MFDSLVWMRSGLFSGLFGLITPINIHFISDITKVLLTVRNSQILISDNTKSGEGWQEKNFKIAVFVPLIEGSLVRLLSLTVFVEINSVIQISKLFLFGGPLVTFDLSTSATADVIIGWVGGGGGGFQHNV